LEFEQQQDPPELQKFSVRVLAILTLKNQGKINSFKNDMLFLSSRLMTIMVVMNFRTLVLQWMKLYEFKDYHLHTR